MKSAVYNFGYFMKEAKTLFRVDFLSNIFSIISIGLIFFILAMVICGWWISSNVVEIIQKEAEINIYPKDGVDISNLIERIHTIDGVREAKIVAEDEAYKRMEEILGREAHILELFEDNPFSSFIEVNIEIEKADSIVEELEKIDDTEYIRDNKKVIDRLQNIESILKVIGVLAMAATGILTLVVVSHIIKQGIYTNREQINTLELLGAPEFFIGFPFILEGLFLTILGGIAAWAMVNLTLHYGYERVAKVLPFIPLPPSQALGTNMMLMLIFTSIVLGLVGSLFGLKSAR
jgi:cell division transport system permease protein